MPEERPATYEEIIQGLARREGVSPALALAVAKQESNFDPTVKSSKGALGIMQLMPDTAKDLGVDPLDPIQNITGGIRYLGQLSKRYDGDVQKTLQAYNGGMKWVDEGTPSPEAQAYASSVLANLSQGVRQQPPTIGPAPMKPVASHGPAAPPESKGIVRELLEPFNPMTRTGRRNITGGIGAAAGAMLAAPTALGSGPIGPATGGLIGAGVATGLEDAAESYLAREKIDPGTVGGRMTEQMAYEAGGQALMWPIRRIARAAMGTSVGRQAVEAIGRQSRAASNAATDMLRNTRLAGADAMEAVRKAAADAVEQTRQMGRSLVSTVKDTGAETVRRAQVAGTEGVAQATKAAADKLAQAELDGATAIADATATYDRMLMRPPSRQAAGAAARETLAGLPGLQGMGDGPAKRALDMAGERVAAAAAQGPPVTMAPVQRSLDEMASKVRPISLFPGETAQQGIGFRMPSTGTIRAAAASTGGATEGEHANLSQFIAKQLGLQESHPLPGVLAKIQQAGPTLSFADAHQLKRLLDEAVNYDRTAKKHLEGLTKGIRAVLREQMSGFQPYDDATRAFQTLVPLYRKGVGKRLIAAAATDPDKVATILTDKNPAAAQAVRDLLVAQSTAGGDAATGQRAWDAVRASYTYDKVIRGGVDKLADRVHALRTQNPEFAQIVYGDPTATHILDNLSAIGEAYKAAVERAGAGTEAAKTAGKEAIAAAKTGGASATQGAADVASAKAQIAQTQADQATRRAARAGRQAVAQQRQTNAQTLTQAYGQARAMREAPRAEAERFRRSSVSRFVGEGQLESELANTARAAALGPTSLWGSLSMIRLLTRNAKEAELLEWAAYSDRNTQRLLSVLLSRVPDRVAADVLREAVAVVNQPVPSHEPAAGAASK